jgi:hypothetical protein
MVACNVSNSAPDFQLYPVSESRGQHSGDGYHMNMLLSPTILRIVSVLHVVRMQIVKLNHKLLSDICRCAGPQLVVTGNMSPTSELFIRKPSAWFSILLYKSQEEDPNKKVIDPPLNYYHGSESPLKPFPPCPPCPLYLTYSMRGIGRLVQSHPVY